jgi:hypothetical protein
LAHAHDRPDQEDERGESFGELLVPGGDATEVLQPTEDALDEVAVTVDALAPADRFAPVGARQDDHLGPGIANRLPQCRRVVGLVGHHTLGGHAIEQGLRWGDVVHLAGAEPALNESPDGIDHDMDLGGQSAARSPERLGAVFWGHQRHAGGHG